MKKNQQAFVRKPGAAPEPQQLNLIEQPDMWGVDVASLKLEREGLRAAGRAPATLRAYAGDWRHFRAWCMDARRQALPADEDTVELYAIACRNDARVSTLRRRMAAIAGQHRASGYSSPVGEGVRAVLFAVAREMGSEERRKAAITPDQLRQISLALPTTAVGQRDRALMVLGFASGCRRSELSALEVGDCRAVDGRAIVLTIRCSKTDQMGFGQEIAVFSGRRPETCPVRQFGAWLDVRGLAPGPLFFRAQSGGSTDGVGGGATGGLLEGRGITGTAVSRIVQRCVALIGLDPREYAGHSLRAGMITAAHSAGASDTAIMARSRHRSVATLAGYIRHGSALDSPDVLALAL